MLTRLRSRLAAAAVSAVAVGCSGGTEPRAECDGPVAVSVSAGTTPTFSWTPDCGVRYLTVQRPLPPSLGTVGSEPQWTIRSEGRLVASPVRYGIRPRGTSEVFAARALTPGEQYSVVVGMTTEGVVGSRVFSP